MRKKVEDHMGSGMICRKCQKGRIIGGRCEKCGFRAKGAYSANVLPEGHLLDHGRYRILRVLGEGGYGITYEALDLQKRRSVAIKEFFPAYAFRRGANGTDAVCAESRLEPSLAHARIRFNEEAALLLSLKHTKEIVDVCHSFEDNKTAYYTMELLRGMDMQKRLQTRGCMSWQELSPIVIQILRALYATHQKGYIHRDVTPDNIFLLNNGTAQLIDFGNARRYRENQQLTAVVKDKFAPREQYRCNGRQGPWTDIYSLCVTIYYSLTGVLPQKATERSSEGDTMLSLQTMVYVPPEVSKAVQIGMSADENRRYQTIADFACGLYPGQAILRGISQQYSQAPAHPADDESGKGRNESRWIPGRSFRRTNAAARQILVCTEGTRKGAQVDLLAGQLCSFGRGQGKVLQYPDGATGISRNQCSVLLHTDGIVYIKDDRSSYGTLLNGRRLIPGIWQPMKSGDTIVFGREVYVLYQR